MLNDVTEETFFSAISIIIRICVGLIVLLVDTLCIYALLRRGIIRHIDKYGVTESGTIEDVNILLRPDRTEDDEWLQNVRYAITVSYYCDEKQYVKRFSPTCAISRRELYPLDIDKGNEIQIKYLASHPFLSIIDVDILKAGTNSEHNGIRLLFFLLPVIITFFYIASFVLL